MLVPMRFFRGLVVASGLALVAACHADEVVVGAPPAPGANVAPPAPTGARPDERGLRLGTKVPPFRLERLEGGGSVGLPNARVTILVFLATWNEPAKKMLTPLQKVHTAYAARGIDVIGIFVDDEVDHVREFGATYGATFAMTWDGGHVVATKLRPPSMPTAYVVDRQGTLRFASFGYHEGDGELLEREAASLL